LHRARTRRGRRHRARLRVAEQQAEPAQLRVKGLARDPELPRGARQHAAVALDRAQQDACLVALQLRPEQAVAGLARSHELRREILAASLAPRGERDEPMHLALQLSHVAGPGMAGEQLLHLRSQRGPRDAAGGGV
jgi:hypothetical protein